MKLVPSGTEGTPERVTWNIGPGNFRVDRTDAAGEKSPAIAFRFWAVDGLGLKAFTKTPRTYLMVTVAGQPVQKIEVAFIIPTLAG